jgi:hypothetical protein
MVIQIKSKSMGDELEIWKQLYDLKYYQVSNLGRIRSLERYVSIGVRNGVEYFRTYPETIKAFRTNGIEPFLFTSVFYADERGIKRNRTIYIHKAVADHFVYKPGYIRKAEAEGKKVYATHIKKNYNNNRFDNVKFITFLELIRSQPKRIADPCKSWRTRREKYQNNWGCEVKPKGRQPRNS